MPGIGIITNPHSRRNRRFPDQVARLGYILGDADTHALTRHPDDIYQVAERFRDNEVDILALNGGDGTNHVTLTTFIEVYGDRPLPRVALLRGGTMNTVSNAIGIRGNPGQILLNITEKYHLGLPFDVSERDLLCVACDGARKYGFMFGCGLISSFLRVYYQSEEPSPTVAFTTLMRVIGSTMVGGELARQLFARFEGTVTVDGQPWTHPSYTALLAATIEQIGLGFRPTYRCREAPGCFHLLGILASARSFAVELPHIRMGQPVRADKIHNEIAREVVFEHDGQMDYMIDGDIHQARTPLRLSTGPRLEIIIG